MSRNKVCQVNKDGVRQHSTVKKEDNFGHIFFVCEKCGNLALKTIRDEKKNIQQD